jgi:hypothetical protein
MAGPGTGRGSLSGGYLPLAPERGAFTILVVRFRRLPEKVYRQGVRLSRSSLGYGMLENVEVLAESTVITEEITLPCRKPR